MDGQFENEATGERRVYERPHLITIGAERACGKTFSLSFEIDDPTNMSYFGVS